MTPFVLRKGDRRITLRRVSPLGTWTITEAKPPTPQENQNRNFRAVVLTVPQAGQASGVVEIQP